MHNTYGDRAFRFRQLLAVLTDTHKEIAVQARYRPRLKVPAETMRIVRQQLKDVRRFRAACGGRSRVFPTVPGGAMRFSTLSLLLAMTRREFEAFGRACQYDRTNEPPRPMMLQYASTSEARSSANVFAAPSQSRKRFGAAEKQAPVELG